MNRSRSILDVYESYHRQFILKIEFLIIETPTKGDLTVFEAPIIEK